MKHIINRLLSIVILLCCSIITHAKADTLDVSVKLPSHPRILLPAGGEEDIKANIQSSEGWKKIHNVIMNECDGFLNQPVSQRIKIGRRLLSVSRECLRRIFFLSYAWRITHDDKYLKRAESEMLAVAAFSDWNPSHFLDVGEMTMAIAIGYDWLYNGLTVQSRDSIKHAILTKGIEPSFDPKSNGWLTWTNNWNQVCNAGICYGAIATFEEHPALSVAVINRAIKVIDLPMKQEYAPDGAYPEGYSYWGYGTSFNVMLIGALEKLFNNDFGLSQKRGFLKTPVYMENMTGATGNAYNYSDSGPGWEPQPAMFWFAQKLKDPSLLFIESKQIAGNKLAALKKERLLPACMVWGAGAKLEKIDAPAKKVYVGQGENPVALMRTSWVDSNAIYMGLKTGTPNASHGHMDIGSFIMEADGVRWAMDFGMQDYESLESKKVDLWNYKQNSQRWQVFRYNNLAHNTLAVNDGLQNANEKASITAWSDEPLFMNAQTDLSDMYKDSLGSAKRGIAIVNNAYSIVRDELEASAKPVSVRWTMLTAASVKVLDKNKAELTMNGKKLLLTVTEPSGVDIITWPTTPSHDYDAPNPGTIFVGFQLQLPANTKQAVTVMLVPDKAAGKVKERIKPLNEWPKQ